MCVGKRVCRCKCVSGSDCKTRATEESFYQDALSGVQICTCTLVLKTTVNDSILIVSPERICNLLGLAMK